MNYSYADRKQAHRTGGTEARGMEMESAIPNSVRLAALTMGKASPTAAEKGRSVNLAEATRARMEQSFGADLSGIRLYESQTVADAGAQAVARGNEIAFAPGKTNFTTRSGQELLGHELSHVVSQQRGEVTGSGFLNNHALEARADREGAMAAAGEQINSGAFAPLSTASAASAAGPMQAKKDKDKQESHDIEHIYDDHLSTFQEKYSNIWSENAKYQRYVNQINLNKKKKNKRRKLIEKGKNLAAGELSDSDVAPWWLQALKMPYKLLRYGLQPILSPIGRKIKNRLTKKSRDETAERAKADTAMANDFDSEDEDAKIDAMSDGLLRSKTLKPEHDVEAPEEMKLRRTNSFIPELPRNPLQKKKRRGFKLFGKWL